MIKIVSGEFRGRRLRIPDGKNTRPTSERARSGLIAWLGPEIQGAEVLDLYAGSGALAIEALSRGASRAVCIEHDRAALRCLRENLRALDLKERARVVQGSVEPELKRLRSRGSCFDLVLTDPPYGSQEWEHLSSGSLLAGVLRPGGQLFLEHSTRHPAGSEPTGLFLRDRKLYGETAFERYQAEARAVEP